VGIADEIMRAERVMLALGQCERIARQQGNQMEVRFCPHSDTWRVTVGVFRQEHLTLEDAAEALVERVTEFREGATR